MTIFSIESALRGYEGQPITQGILADVLKGYLRPHHKIQDLAKKNMLLQVRRGLYVTGPALKLSTPSSYSLANHIYGPSYVSLEGALGFWNYIPERVMTITSMTTGSSKSFSSVLGNFRYIHMKLPYYSFGIRMIEVGPGQTVLMASAEKALCDIVATKKGLLLRSVSQAKEFLEDDLRIDRDDLRKLDTVVMESWVASAPKKNSMAILIKTIRQL